VTENNKKGRDSQKIRDNAIQRIKEIWEVEKIEDAFPAGIKPATLGMSAISNIKSIAIRFPNLAEAQALFVKECKDSNGRPVPVSFSHTDRIVKELIKARKENEPSTPNLKANPTNSEAWTGNTSASTTMKATKAPTKSSNVVGQSSEGINCISLILLTNRSLSLVLSFRVPAELRLSVSEINR
jgi:hypothetical protein